jgi:hypothetical protein
LKKVIGTINGFGHFVGYKNKAHQKQHNTQRVQNPFFGKQKLGYHYQGVEVIKRKQKNRIAGVHYQHFPFHLWLQVAKVGKEKMGQQEKANPCCNVYGNNNNFSVPVFQNNNVKG